MTKEQLDSIRELRRENYSYQFIGDTLGIPMNSVKSACRRYGFVAVGDRKTKLEKENAPICKYCNKPIVGGRTGQSFCSDACRTKWWRSNQKITVITPSK